jgi:hypothetical protein
MCEGLSFLDLQARVEGIYGAPRKARMLLADPRAADYLKRRDPSPWRAMKKLVSWLPAPASRAL